MNTRPHVIRIAAAVIAACGLSLMVVSVNSHGDHTQLGVSSFIRAQSQAVLQQRVRERAQEARGEFGGGLELIDMFQCMCGGPLGTDIRGWVGLWIVAVLVGGLPTAVVLYSGLHDPTRDR